MGSVEVDTTRADGDKLTSYQRFVVFAAWMGLGFDLMDSILFNFVAPIAVPDLLHLAARDPATKSTTAFMTGLLTSVMLFGWAIGGIAFGRLSDRVGRTRTVVLTMLLFSVGTLACALAPNLALFATFRFVAALGIGGEWAAGATLVAETVPENRRVQMGAVLFTSAPAGVFLAILLSHLFTGEIESIAKDPSLSWRVVMGCGALPAFAALAIRRKLKEPAHWTGTEGQDRGRMRDLFSPEMRRRTLGGLAVGTVALVTFWTFSAFLPTVASFLADEIVPKPEGQGLVRLKASLVTRCMTAFNVGGLVGSVLAAPLALRWGRRPLFFAYFAWSTAGILLAFVPSWSPETRIVLVGVGAVSIYGVFGAFQFYLPELFPARLRGTGAGFCLNTGRFLTVLGPFVVGWVARGGVPILAALRYLAWVPAAGFVLLLLGFGVETRRGKLDG
jgi:MFS family permease